MSNELPLAYPLQWPVGWRRVENRTEGRFGTRQHGLTVYAGVARVLDELRRLGMDREDIVISTNVPSRQDGMPRANGVPTGDPGVAVYWRWPRGRRYESRCIALDTYTTVAANLAAIAATLEAMRKIERHGSAQIMDRVFQGFVALPAPEQWFQVLEVSSHATRVEIEAAHARLTMKFHPDRLQGDTEKMARINVARDEGLARL